MSIDKVKQAIKVADASGRNLSLQELRGMFPDLPVAVLEGALNSTQELPDGALEAGKVKAQAGVIVKSAEEKVKEEVFALMGTGKETANNKGTPGKGGQNLA